MTGKGERGGQAQDGQMGGDRLLGVKSSLPPLFEYNK